MVTDPYTEREGMKNTAYSVKYTYIHWPHCFYSRRTYMYHIHHVNFCLVIIFHAFGARVRSGVKKASFQKQV